MPRQRLKLHILLNYAVLPENVIDWNWSPFFYILGNLITNSIHAWLNKDYKSTVMILEHAYGVIDYIGSSLDSTTVLYRHE